MADIPVHIGIIMDGNGRWAVNRKQPRTSGHREGLAVARNIVSAASEQGVKFLTLYVFSTENWKRTADEVGFLMGLIRHYLNEEMDFCRKNRIRVRHAGSMDALPADIASSLRKISEETAEFSGMQVVLAINYGGRDEIVRAVRKMIESGVPQPITEDSIHAYLDNPDIPDPDLIIRTAGEYRISNFLLWESAYAEYHSSDTLWPDWTEADLIDAIQAFGRRKRRFGGLNE
ncbi:isoprenyl transferase [Spirochaetia bacterium]|nr:isoprenyl transferase [Spirochaetia bacterium]GHU33831.1 isoprenyl transferase [Spirochaetia bacterium]